MDTVAAMLVPPPITPMFQTGGPLHGYNEDLTLVALGFAALAALDWLCVRPVCRPEARFYVLHTATNIVVCLFAFPDVLRVFTEDPHVMLRGPFCSIIPNCVIAALHLYRLAGFSLTRNEKLMHFGFVALLLPVGVLLKNTGGVIGCFGAFFMSGFPGAINYAMLTLLHHGVVSKAAEQRWNANINQWVRGPALSVLPSLGGLVLRKARQTHRRHCWRSRPFCFL